VRFLLDQSADARLIPHLLALGHDATRIGREHPHGLPAEDVLAIAYAERRILIANDLDFGDLVVRLGRAHTGVILFRLGATDLATKIQRLDDVLRECGDRFDRFVVVTLQSIRVRA
jgi:predicted nuclease of predicted toxin-antitoxin system